MKLRRKMTLEGPVVQVETDAGWISLEKVVARLGQDATDAAIGDPAHDMIAALSVRADRWRDLAPIINEIEPDGDAGLAPTLPVQPASFCDFMLFEDHVITSSRGYVKRFLPRLYPFARGIECLTRRPFQRFKPHSLWYQQPIYYFGNHLTFIPSHTDVPWPEYTSALDYELELGAVLAQPLKDATPEEALKAIGGFVVINDFSARDVQKDEMDSGFGPQKAKHFASSMSEVIVTADEVTPHIDTLKASVSINRQRVAECHSRGMYHSLAEAIAFASQAEQLHPGELFGTGTFPGGTGIENGAWLSPGDRVSLTIDRIGSVENTIVRAATP